MKNARTTKSIQTALSATDQAWLASTFARNRSRFRGWRMDGTGADPAGGGDPGKGGSDPAKPGSADDPAEDKGGAPLGDGGKAALDAERSKRKAAEDANNAIKDALLEAFGMKQDPRKSNEETLAEIQQSVAGLARRNTVSDVARDHGITEAADIKLLTDSALEGDALAEMAKRLAPDDPSQPVKPTSAVRADPSQGGSGEDPTKPDPGPGRGRLAAAFEEQYDDASAAADA